MPKKWQICIVLFLATTLNYLDRQTMSILAPALQKELHLDNEALGWLFAVFYYAYTFSQMAVGPILDRANLRWAFTFAVLLWSVVSALTGLANGFVTLLIFRLALGVVESANWPAGMRVLSRLLEPRERALGNGIFTSGTSVGALVAPGLILGISAIFGWRLAFVLIGSLGAIWICGWLLMTRDRSMNPIWREPTPHGSDGLAGQRRIFQSILKSSRFLPVLAVAVCVSLMIHENWRWQAWYRVAQKMIARGEIGAPIGYGFRTRTRDGIGDEPYAKQPYFRQLRRLLIDEVLVHHMDTARFLFGEIDSVHAQASRRNPNVIAEDQAILVLAHEAGVHGWIDGHRLTDPNPDGPAMGDAFFEGELGIISIPATGDVYRNNVLAWKNDVAVGYRGDSVRATQAHFIAGLKAGGTFESAGRSYLRTFAAVEAAYRSISERRCIPLSEILKPGSAF